MKPRPHRADQIRRQSSGVFGTGFDAALQAPIAAKISFRSALTLLSQGEPAPAEWLAEEREIASSLRSSQ